MLRLGVMKYYVYMLIILVKYQSLSLITGLVIFPCNGLMTSTMYDAYIGGNDNIERAWFPLQIYNLFSLF